MRSKIHGGAIDLEECVGQYSAWYFHVDNTFVKTTRTLVVHPDRLISDYFAGRRKGYMAPIPLLAVWCVILLFFGHIEGGAGTISTIEGSATHNWIVEHYTLLTIVTVPFMVLAVKIAFRKAGAARYNWVEYLLGCCYLSVLYILLSLVLTPIGWVLDASYYTVYGWTSMVLCLLPTYWAAYSFFPDKFWKTLGAHTVGFGPLSPVFCDNRCRGYVDNRILAY